MSAKLEGVVTHCPNLTCANAYARSQAPPSLISRHTSVIAVVTQTLVYHGSGIGRRGAHGARAPPSS